MNYFCCNRRWLNCCNFLLVNAARQLLIEASRELTFITIWLQINLKAPFDEDCKWMLSVFSRLLFLLFFKHFLQLSSKSFISTWLKNGYWKCLLKKSSLVIPGSWIKWLTWQCRSNTKKQQVHRLCWPVQAILTASQWSNYHLTRCILPSSIVVILLQSKAMHA